MAAKLKFTGSGPVIRFKIPDTVYKADAPERMLIAIISLEAVRTR